jgi:hypothetical protein
VTKYAGFAIGSIEEELKMLAQVKQQSTQIPVMK